MPVLTRRPVNRALSLEALPAAHPDEDGGIASAAGPPTRPFVRSGLLEACANPKCRSGWLHLWRGRNAPVFEGGWNCSAECTAARLQAAVTREMDGRGSALEFHRHRVPLGLLMLENGWITAEQLRGALKGQKHNGGGRLGHWLIAGGGVGEDLVTRALGLQWSCAVLPLESHDPESLASLLPRLFVDAFGALPLRVAAGRLVYLGFEDRLDPVLALALERMSGLRVENGLVRGSLFRPAHTRMLQAAFPPVELLEAASEPALVRTLAGKMERARPVDSRLVRVHDCLWLRMWRKPQTGTLPESSSVQDLICTVAGS